MKKSLFCIFLLWVIIPLATSQTVTLKDCYDKARDHYPLLQGKEKLGRMTDLSIRNVKSRWLPQSEVSGQASWQNEVPGIDGDASMAGLSLPEAPKDQYNMMLDVNQTIYDAGRTSASSQLEEISGELEQQDIEVQLYQLRHRITELFFSVLMVREQKQQVQSKIRTIESRREELRDMLENGAVEKSEVQSMDAEYHQATQQLVSVRNDMDVLLENLSSFIGKELESASDLKTPSAGDLLSPSVHPEVRYYDLQRQVIDHQMKVTQRDRWPVLGAFGRAGYGNPGFNMLKDEFRPMLMVGIRLEWTPWDWQQTRREKLALQEKKELVQIREETFRVNQQRSVNKMKGEAEKYLEMMEHDDEIVRLREAIAAKSEKRLKNGTITAADYLSDLDAKVEARIKRNIHHLQYLQSMAVKRLEEASEP
ncbi:MAG: TolC family protein [Marinilabilia sp.]